MMNVQQKLEKETILYQKYAKHAFDNAQSYINMLYRLPPGTYMWNKYITRAIMWQEQAANWAANARHVMRIE